MSGKTAVILFNLGGPDSLRAVRPFLRNLFSDPAILRVSPAARFALSRLISLLRARVARRLYAKIGGKSPIYEQTCAQAEALESRLNREAKGEHRVFVSMRYWHPRSKAVVEDVGRYCPDKIILLPLYPQYSTTTTASSFAEWEEEAVKAGLDVPTARICCYPDENHFIAAHVDLLKDAFWKASQWGDVRILFSAHGLPVSIVKGGDPYQWQVEKTVQAIMSVFANPAAEWCICYQSRVGRLEWIGPSTEEELKRAGQEGKPVVVVPVAFVSEHSETLVELDIEYAKLAREAGVKDFVRVPTLGISPGYIECLHHLCEVAASELQAGKVGVCSARGGRLCPEIYGPCACREKNA